MRVKMLLFLLSISVAALAQNDSIYIWNKWCARKDTLLLFRGGNNTIQVFCKSMKPEEFKFKSLDRSLRIGPPEINKDTVSMLAMPYPTKDKQMRLAIINAKTSKIIKTVYFTSDSIPNLIAQLGTIETTEAPKKKVLEQNRLKAIFPKSLYSYPYTIKQFSFKTQTPKGAANINMNGFFLTTNVLTEINETPEGTTIEFYNIKATCPECEMRTLGDLKIKIK